MESLPATMRALGVRKYTKPDGYEILELSLPQIKAPDEVLLRMHAVGLFTGDAQLAAGGFKLFTKTSFPLILGRSGAGVVVAVGSAVTSLRVGDAVYGMNLKRPMAAYYADGRGGLCAEYAVAAADLLLPKPAHLSFEEAAAGLGNIVTAIQLTREAMALGGGGRGGGGEAWTSLEGKTVLVTAGLGAATSVAAQYAKNVMGAKEVIATVSTGKVELVEKLMPGVVDRVVDYQTQDLVTELGAEKVDFLYNARFDVGSYLPVMKKESGVVALILGIPGPKLFEEMMGEGVVTFWMKWALALGQLYYKWKLFGTNIKMKFVSGDMGNREDLETAGGLLAAGKVKPVKTIVAFEDLEAIKAGCDQARTLKGKVGQLVVKIL